MRELSGWLTSMLGLAMLLLGIALTVIGFRMGDALGDGRGIVVIIGIAMTVLGGWLNKTGRQIAFEPGEQFLARYHGPIVTYLRSFNADRKADASRGGRVKIFSALPESRLTEEEQIARAMRPIAPMVAIGRPGEMLPQLGAYRVYTSDDTWQDMVHSMLSRSELVVLRAGGTDGFWWEVWNVLNRIEPERIVFLLPKKRQAFEEFRDRIQTYITEPIPDYEPGSVRASFGGIMWFDKHYVPHIEPAKYLWTAPFRHEIAVVLRQILAATGKEFSSPTPARASGAKRLLAGVIDLSFFALSFALGLLLDSALGAEFEYAFWALGLALLVYVVLQLTPLRASPGKLVLRMRVMDAAALEPRSTQIVLRIFFGMASVMIFWPALVSIILMLTGNRTAHDAIIGTDVFVKDGGEDADPLAMQAWDMPSSHTPIWRTARD